MLISGKGLTSCFFMSTKSLIPDPSTAAEAAVTRRAYLVEKVNPDTGEITWVPKYKYITGAQKQYRFNGQNGQFNRSGGPYEW